MRRNPNKGRKRWGETPDHPCPEFMKATTATHRVDRRRGKPRPRSHGHEVWRALATIVTPSAVEFAFASPGGTSPLMLSRFRFAGLPWLTQETGNPRGRRLYGVAGWARFGIFRGSHWLKHGSLG